MVRGSEDLSVSIGKLKNVKAVAMGELRIKKRKEGAHDEKE